MIKNASPTLQPEGTPELVSFGARSMDEACNGGLARGALHEIYAATTSDAMAAAGFVFGLAYRAAGHKAAGQKPIVWVRQDYLDTETGQPHGTGLVELGLDPDRILLVRAHDATDVLRAAGEVVRCGAVGALVIEPWGDPRVLDLTASRRLSLAAAKSGVTAFMLRVCAQPSPSSAVTRWEVQPRPSATLEANAHCDYALLSAAAKASRNAPGLPAFAVTLRKHRGGLVVGRQWLVEWNRDQRCFQDQSRANDAALPRRVVSLPCSQPAIVGTPQQQDVQRTG